MVYFCTFKGLAIRT